MGKVMLLILVFLPLLTAFLVYPLRTRDRRLRDRFIRLIPGVELFCALMLLAYQSTVALPGLCGLGLRFSSGSLQSLLALITAFLWMLTALPCEEYFQGAAHCNRFYFFYLMTLGAVMGVFLAADLATAFIFFEMMSFTSYVWVAWPETPDALRAAKSYLGVAVFGGMVLLVGLFLIDHLLGTLEFSAMAERAAALSPAQQPLLLAAGFCCLTGFGAKAGLWPLHVWMPKAYPAAPAPATALLSGILSKSGIFGILVVSRFLLWGNLRWNEVLLALGTVTMVAGALMALLTLDLKRALAGSSMSQIGFILLGVAMQGYLGEENAAAAWGTVLHMLNHSLIKLVLFVASGVVYLGCRRCLDLNEIRGFGRGKPWLRAVFFVGAASVAGVPGFSGYISKTLLHESLVEYIRLLEGQGAAAGLFRGVEWLFLISGGLTAAYMAKLFGCIFLDPRPAGAPLGRKDYMSPATRNALTLGAGVTALLGVFPSRMMEPIGIWGSAFLLAGHGESVHYFALANLKGAAISLTIGAAVYFGLVRTALRRKKGETVFYPAVWPEWLDLETLVYRPVLRALSFLGAVLARAAASMGELVVLAGERLLFARAPGIFVPKRNENFGAYGKKPPRMLITEAFSFDLLLAGTGLVVMMLYILLH